MLGDGLDFDDVIHVDLNFPSSWPFFRASSAASLAASCLFLLIGDVLFSKKSVLFVLDGWYTFLLRLPL